MKSFKPTLILIAIFLLIGLPACSGMTSGDPTATPVSLSQGEEVPPTEEPTIEEATPTFTPTVTEMPSQTPTQPPPTATQAPPTATQRPTAIPTEEPPAYFIEEFNGNIDSWSYFMMSGNENTMDLYTEDGYLVFDLEGEDQWVYVIYDEYYYPEVRIDVLAENRGKNSNSVSLICNYSDRDGWYEFNVSNGGMYDILVYSEIDDEYATLASGGSTNVVTGRSENLYTAICEGNQLALYINGVLEREYTDNLYNLREGQVGVSVSSFDVLPILVYIDFFSIDYP
jgi:hypothetical protein